MTKRSLLVVALIVGGCNSGSTSKVPPGSDAASASGGSGGKGLGGAASTGGTSGLGGTSSSGGALGSGGTAGTGGSPGSGGGAATGGRTGTDGATSSGGATGGAKGDAAVDARSDVSVGTGGGPGTGGTAGGSGGAGTGGTIGTLPDAGRDSSGDAKSGDAKIDLQPDASGDGYTKPVAVPDGGTCPYAGHVSYTFTKSGDSTVDNLITAAMDQAIAYYNCYTNITKADKVIYNPSVQTADGNSNGTIQFGSDTGYMILRVAMHEISHTLGIGTASNWDSFVAIPAGGSSGPWKGANGIAQRQALLPDVWQQQGEEVLTADKDHFWPYGLNKPENYKSEADLLGHCAMVMAMRKDMGM